MVLITWATIEDTGEPAHPTRSLARAFAARTQWGMEVNEGSDQKWDIQTYWMAAHARLNNEFT